MELDELLARAEIDSTLQRYCRGVDRLDLDLVLSAFHDDAVDQHGFNNGRPADIFPVVFGRLSAMESTTHFLGRSSYEFSEDDSADVETYAVAYHRLRPDDTEPRRDMVVGFRYVDVFARRNTRWRITHRAVVVDWSRIDPVTAEMDVAAFIPGERDRTDASYRR